ncbi:MAG: sodium:solute symporter family protein [Deltaproteobacteria bacterium]|nr:sodium:solute symporter family protein [Deltaproteobacteria bacterium]
MSAAAFAIGLVGLYAAITIVLSVIGMRKTKDLKSFAIGKGDMGPVLVGITMSSSIASTATFVINPGFVWADGLAAWAHYGLAAGAGLTCALLVMTKGFHRVGAKVSAVTLPNWLERRYESAWIGRAFALLTLLYITFIVLILSGSALIIGALFGIGYHVALVCVLAFVFSYVLMGGTYAHAYTNAFQGGLMLIIALMVFGTGLLEYGADFGARLSAVGESYSAWLNPESTLYHSTFGVFIAAFVVTAALMLQPHIITKILYLKRKEDLRRFLAVTILSSVAFSGMLFVGFWARFSGMAVSAQDKVVIEWIGATYPPLVVSFVLVTLLAAGMSTLDGILVSISTVVVNDLVLPSLPRLDEERRMRFGLQASRGVLVAVGLVSLALAWDPPELLGLFAQQGVYGLVAASAAPMLLGILVQGRVPAALAGGLGVLGVATHFVLKLAGVSNPAVSAAWGILASLAIGAGWWAWSRRRSAGEAAVSLPGVSEGAG